MCQQEGDCVCVSVCVVVRIRQVQAWHGLFYYSPGVLWVCVGLIF